MPEVSPDTWRIIYALSLLIMGTAVLARAIAYPSSGFRNRLLALGLFALLHAADTSFWHLGIADEGVAAHVRTAFYTSSYIALYYFAFGWRTVLPQAVHYIAAITAAVWALSALADFQQETEIFRRATSAVPAALCAAFAILTDKDFRFEQHFYKHMTWFAAIGFIVYAVFQLPPAADYVTLGQFSLPVVAARTASVVAITISALTLLNHFDTILRLQSKEMLEEIGKKLSSALEIGKLGILEMNLLTGTMIWSRHFRQMIGEHRDSIDATHAAFLARVHEEDRKMVEVTQKAAIMERLPYDIHYRILGADGSIRYVQEEGTFIETAGRKEAKLLCVVLDVTALTEARFAAESASDAKSNFLANLSHELRTPLNAIIGFGELLQLGLKKDSSEEYGGLIKKSGRHLLSLINDILDLSKISAGKWTLDEKRVDLRAVALSCTELMEGSPEAADLRIVVNVPADLPAVLADERAIQQILINLTSNAMKNTPKEGVLTMFSELLPSGEISFGVADTGRGIAESDQKRVFDAFAQAERDARLAGKGTGLGLPIVKGLVHAHGGRIDLFSRVGEGTRVTITLPRERVLHEMVSTAA
jgi:signal transduction histidine kinase